MRKFKKKRIKPIYLKSRMIACGCVYFNGCATTVGGEVRGKLVHGVDREGGRRSEGLTGFEKRRGKGEGGLLWEVQDRLNFHKAREFEKRVGYAF